jgi:signal transduction histidine kinase
MVTFDVITAVKASHALSGELALDKLLLRLMSLVAENAGAERGALLLLSEGALWIEAELSRESGATLPSRRVSVDDSGGLSAAIVHHVARTHESVVLHDAENEGAFAKDVYIAKHRPKSVLCMPLLHQATLKGVLYLENNLTTQFFTEPRTQLLSILCAQMAISLENAYLYGNLEQKVALERNDLEDAQARLEEQKRSRRATKDLYRMDLEDAQARLVHIEQEATNGRMADKFAQEMRDALVGAKLFLGAVYNTDREVGGLNVYLANSESIARLQAHLRKQLSADALAPATSCLAHINDNEKRAEKAIRNVGHALDRALAITGLILEYAEIDRQQKGTDPVALRSLVDSIFAELAKDLAKHGITTEVAISPESMLIGKEAHFSSIFKNLVLNARDALIAKKKRDPGRRLIRVDLTEAPDGKVVRVTDTGIGIAAAHRARLFEPFFSTKPGTRTGLGLGMVQKLVSIYGGRIDVETTVNQGSTFAVHLPPPWR